MRGAALSVRQGRPRRAQADPPAGAVGHPPPRLLRLVLRAFGAPRPAGARRHLMSPTSRRQKRRRRGTASQAGPPGPCPRALSDDGLLGRHPCSLTYPRHPLQLPWLPRRLLRRSRLRPRPPSPPRPRRPRRRARRAAHQPRRARPPLQRCSSARERSGAGRGASAPAAASRRALARRCAAALTPFPAADRVLQDLHLQGAEAGAPGHRHQLQGDVHHVRPPAGWAPAARHPPAWRPLTRPALQELVHQRHLREDCHGGGQAVPLQQEAHRDQPRDPDLRAPHPAGRAGQARRVRGHQVRTLRHARRQRECRSNSASPRRASSQGRDQVHLLVSARRARAAEGPNTAVI